MNELTTEVLEVEVLDMNTHPTYKYRPRTNHLKRNYVEQASLDLDISKSRDKKRSLVLSVLDMILLILLTIAIAKITLIKLEQPLPKYDRWVTLHYSFLFFVKTVSVSITTTSI